MDKLRHYKATIWVDSKRYKIAAHDVLNIREAQRRMNGILLALNINQTVELTAISEIKAFKK